MNPPHSAQEEEPLFETHPLFATPLWLATFPDAARINPIWRRVLIEAMEADRGISQQKRSNRRGWRCPAFDLEEEEVWAPLGGFVRKLLQSLLRPDLSYALRSTGANVHLEGGFNYAHVHSNCIISGVYYISCPPGSGELVFEDPRVQAVFANAYNQFHQDQGHPDVSLTPSEGLLVLFPSWLSHRVEPSASFEPRISVPINVVLRHGIGPADGELAVSVQEARVSAADSRGSARSRRGFGGS